MVKSRKGKSTLAKSKSEKSRGNNIKAEALERVRHRKARRNEDLKKEKKRRREIRRGVHN